MDKKATENKTIKTIVPIRGNLLEKIKNKLKNNGSNGSHSQSTEVNDVINNNKNDSVEVPKMPVIKQKVSKIEIQKIEKVNLKISELIKPSNSEPIKSGRNMILREASPNPVNILKRVEAEKCILSKLEVPVVETKKNELHKVDKIDIIHEQLIPCSSNSLLKNVNVETKIVEKEEKYVENVSKNVVSINNNISEEEEEGSELMDINEEAWLHDISVMIGEARIREIDNGLKKIPTVVTGNRIQTENVELKLIINHLLGRLNAKSVIETMGNTQSSFLLNKLKDAEEYSDSFDEMPTDFDEYDSNFESSGVPESSTVIKNEETVDQSFSVPLKNSIAIVTIPSMEKMEIEIPKSESPEVCKVVEDVKLEIQEVVEVVPTKKRRGRPPLATSTSKKAKKSAMINEKLNKEEPAHVDHPRKLSLRSSSRESSVEPCKESKRSNSKADISKNNIKSPVRVQRSSSREKVLTKSLAEKDIKPNKKVTRVQELKASESDSSAINKIKSSESSTSDCENDKKPIRNRKSKKTKDNPESSQKITDFFTKEENDNESKIINVVTTDKKPKKASKRTKKVSNGQSNKTVQRKRKILSDSESDSECETLCKASELKSITQNDSNSQVQSSIIERYDYLNKSSLFPDKIKKEKNVISNHPLCADLNEIVNKCKEMDPTYVKPPEKQKRPYLITSAFKGNHINSDDSSHSNMSSSVISSTGQPSVSRDDSSLINDYEINKIVEEDEMKKNGQNTIVMSGIKDRMMTLINDQKEKIMSNTKHHNLSKSAESTPPLSPKMSAKKGRPQQMTARTVRRRIKIEDVDRKVFEQEPLETTIEDLVCYDEIVEAIRITDPPRRNGRASSAVKPLEEQKKIELKAKLKCLENFKCGSCNNLVTKHKWRDHLIEHGGVAWIKSFESPIDINDWNESVRRLNNYLRIYKLESYRCPNCSCDKKSALGHLSHIYTCGESEEVIESRKVTCQHCEERVLPYLLSWHRSKCKVLNKREEVFIAGDEGDDEDENENSKSSSVNSSGRMKRKAGKKAEKTFKMFIKKLSDDPMDQLIATINGQFICSHCTKIFGTKELALEHLEKDHIDKREGGDFEASDSDAVFNEESSETDGSSGVESSDIQSVDENEDDQCDSINISNSKGGKASTLDSQEMKNGRKYLSSYADSFHNIKISNRTIKLTKQFINDNVCDNILTEFSPKYKKCDNTSLASHLIDSKFHMKSMKFATKVNDYYMFDYGMNINQEWRQLDIGNCVGDKNSLTLFCGGSISSLDWSQSLGEKNYLAVACNGIGKRNIDLEETSKTCIQVYEFANLVNNEFSSFENSSKFLYFFTINEGPVWSIKFHPMVLPNEERLGLLAVTSSNHNIYVYSLPYLKNDQSVPVMISLEPSFNCKTIDGFWLYQDKYMMQATVVSWFYRKEHDLHLLCGGFINGMISIWKFNDIEKSEDENKCTVLLPFLTFQPHREPITALDFKYMLGTKIHLLTAALDRDVKVYSIDSSSFQEISSHYSSSRLLCAEWWMHWPGFVCGNDSCYSNGSLMHRQPIEFGIRNLQLFTCFSSVTTCNINHWLNLVAFTSESGDLLITNPSQLMTANPKDRWKSFGNSILSYTDVVNLDPDNTNELGIIFNDIKSKLEKRPKDFRSPLMSEHITQLQINHISFNRNEISYHFYALGYETGFVRIRHLKNFK